MLTENKILHPISQSSRIISLDAMRGFALCGILFANLVSFAGFYSLDLASIHQLPTSDRITLLFIDWFIESKFYALFSILLGAGFALQMHKTNQRDQQQLFKTWRKRMLILLAIGLIHMHLIWHGDILTLYALLGLLLPWFHHLDNKQLINWIVPLLIIPLLIQAILIQTSTAEFWSSLAGIKNNLKEYLGYANQSQL